MKRTTWAFVLLITLFMFPDRSIAWNDIKSHPKLAERAVQSTLSFRVFSYLATKHNINISALTPIEGKSLSGHLYYGSTMEDEISVKFGTRANNHFHDPTKQLNVAGLYDSLLTKTFKGMSAISWAGEDASNVWTINRFYSLLEESFSSPSEEYRIESLALAFRTAGHLMHLLQDMAVPAHVRNQLRIGHTGKFKFSKIPLGSSFEAFLVENPFFIRSVEPHEIPKFSAFTDYFDTGDYRLNNAESVTGKDIGLAEYTNSNFFSEFQAVDESGSIWPGTYPNPDVGDFFYHNVEFDSRENYPHVAPLLPPKFRSSYVGRLSDDPENNFTYLGRLGYFYNIHGSDKSIFLDEKCYREYLPKLAPKAVAYSAGLLELLFKGDIDFYVNLLNSEATIVNASDEFIQGSFRFFHDDETGWRKEMTVPIELALHPGELTTVPLTITSMPVRTVEHTITILFRGNQGEQKNIVTGNTNTFFPYEM